MDKEYVAIISYFRNYSTSATLNNLFEEFHNNNIQVLFFSPSTNGDKIDENILVFDIPNLGCRIYKLDFIQLFKNCFSTIKTLKKYRVKNVIAIDNSCFIFAVFLSLFVKKIKIMYLCFELSILDDLRYSGKRSYWLNAEYWFYKLTRMFISKLDVLIIQDKIRKEIFQRESKLSILKQVIYLPIAPRTSISSNVSYSIPQLKNIPRNKIKIIYSGSYMNWTGLEKLLDLIEANIFKDQWFIFHNPINSLNNYILGSRSLFDRIIYLSNRPGMPLSLITGLINPIQRYLEFLTQFDFGLISYAADLKHDQNMFNVGLSSSKFGCYMAACLPTIVVSGNNFFSKVNSKYNFGIALSNYSKMSESLILDSQQLESFRMNTKIVYSEILEQNIPIKKIITALGVYGHTTNG
jgi:hypothetical protein